MHIVSINGFESFVGDKKKWYWMVRIVRNQITRLYRKLWTSWARYCECDYFSFPDPFIHSLLIVCTSILKKNFLCMWKKKKISVTVTHVPFKSWGNLRNWRYLAKSLFSNIPIAYLIINFSVNIVRHIGKTYGIANLPSLKIYAYNMDLEIKWISTL